MSVSLYYMAKRAQPITLQEQITCENFNKSFEQDCKIWYNEEGSFPIIHFNTEVAYDTDMQRRERKSL